VDTKLYAAIGRKRGLYGVVALLLLVSALSLTASARAGDPRLPDSQGYNCLQNSFPGYHKSGSGVPTSLSGSWSLSGNPTFFGAPNMYAIVYYQTSVGFYLEIDYRIYYSNNQWNVLPILYWETYNYGPGSYYGSVTTGVPNGSFNFERQPDGTYKIYVNGVLTLSNVSFGGDSLTYAGYHFLTQANNPCIDYHGTWNVANSLSGWTLDPATYHAVNLLTNYSFEVYTLSPI
jgi:hypothetical protein